MPQSPQLNTLSELFFSLDESKREHFNQYLTSPFSFADIPKLTPNTKRQLEWIFGYMVKQSGSNKKIEIKELAKRMRLSEARTYSLINRFGQELLDFIIHTQFHADKSLQALIRLRYAMSRNELDDHYHRELKVAEAWLEEGAMQERTDLQISSSFALSRAHEFEVLKLAQNLYTMNPKLDMGKALIGVAEKFAQSFLTEKLMSLCAKPRKDHFFKGAPEERIIFEVLELSDAERDWLENTKAPIPSIYYLFYQFFLAPEYDESLFLTIKKQLHEHLGFLPLAHLRQFYFHLINGHQMRLRATKRGRKVLIAEAISDLETGIEKKYLWRGNSLKLEFLSVGLSWYKGLANKSGTEKKAILHRAETFMEAIQYESLVMPAGYNKEFAKDSLVIQLLFERQAYREVLQKLAKSDGKSLHIIQALHKRCVIIKCYYEENEQLIDADLDSLRNCLARDEKLSEGKKKEFRAFYTCMQKLVRLKETPKGEISPSKLDELQGLYKKYAPKMVEAAWIKVKIDEFMK